MSTGTGTAGPGARAAGGSPESGLGGELAAVHHDHANGDHDHDHDDNDQDNDHESDFDYYYCEPDLQPVGYCKALYAFEGELVGF